MIVDDHAATREMIRQLLAPNVAAVCECASGEEAVERATEFQPDWITMDIHMTGINGLTATSQIKQQIPGARVIIVTAENHLFFRRMADQAGANGYVCKENLLELPTFFTTTETPPPAAS